MVALSFCRLLGLGCPKQAFAKIATPRFISSLDATNPQYLGQVVRAHWGIENNLHWVLDYAFDEDSQRTRMGNSAANMSIIRHLSLNLLKSEKTAKVRY